MALILPGVLSEFVAQTVMFVHKARRGGSPNCRWNRSPGGYSLACVFAMALGVSAAPLAAGQVALELGANSMDLMLALEGISLRDRRL